MPAYYVQAESTLCPLSSLLLASMHIATLALIAVDFCGIVSDFDLVLSIHP